ncbi:hypothetical protein Q5752_005546 [Cryptotrichosporon argae]
MSRPVHTASPATAFTATNGIRNRLPRPANATSSSSRPRKRSEEKGHRRRLPQLSRGWVREAFRQFGEHCARNQVRTLLIDCIVMTNLFYPSLALYLQKRFPSTSTATTRRRGYDLSFLSRPLSETFFPRPSPLLPNLEWGGWWARDTGQDDVTWVATPAAEASGGGEELLWARAGWADVRDILERTRGPWSERDRRLVEQVVAIAEGWPGPGECVRHWEGREDGAAQQDGRCYVVSPDNTDGALPLASLSGIEATDSVYRSLAIPFQISPDLQTDFQTSWQERLSKVAAEYAGTLSLEYLDSHRDPDTGSWNVLLSPRSEPDPTRGSPYPPRLVLFLYAILLTTLLAQLSNATKVHSRFGLAFTGVVQLCCSAVMSFSVLALLGWKGWGWSLSENVLPTYVLPFVIVVVGAENMSTLTRAVFSVPFSYSVPVRIGIGLSKVGSTIAITSLTDLFLMLAVWLLVDLKPVREFCLFSAVVIITDWFMLHTFFLTVLSIDAQRLEMADLIAASGAPEADRKDDSRRTSTPVKRFSWRNVLRARTAKSGSLILLLTCVGLLYYHNERDKTFGSAGLHGYTGTSSSETAPTPSVTAAIITTASQLAALSPTASFWHAINPFGHTSIHVHVAPALLLVLPHAGHRLSPSALMNLSPPSRLSLARIKPILNIVKVFVVPQAISAFCLYILLLYLLKDADLLDAQRDRLGRGEVAHTDDDSDDGQRASGNAALQSRGMAAHVLPCSHESDVDLVACSQDGATVVTVASDDSICLWRFIDEARGTREMLVVAGLNDAVAAVAVSADGSAIAVASPGGHVQLWTVPERGSAVAVAPTRTQLGKAQVTSIAFHEGPATLDDPFALPSPVSKRPSLLAALSDGSVISIDDKGDAVDVVPAFDATGGPVQMLRMRDELVLVSSSALWPRIEAGQQACDVVAVGYESGLIEVFDFNTGASLVTLGQAGQPLKAVVIASSPTRCTTCTIQSDGLFVISSTGTATYIDRLLPRTDVLCRCASNRRPSGAHGVGDEAEPTRVRERAGPLVMAPSPARARPSPGGSPRKSPGLLPPVTNGEFPLSSHGARRLSNFQDRTLAGASDDRIPASPLDRRSSHSALALTPSATPSQDTPFAPSSTGVFASASYPMVGAAGGGGAPIVWSDLEIVPLGAVASDTFALLDEAGLLLGLRRAGTGVDNGPWRVWTLDLASAWNGTRLVVGSASLAALERAVDEPGTSGRGASDATDGAGAGADADAGISTSERRRDRMLDLDGRAAFPARTPSRSVPTHAAVAYTQLGPVAVRPPVAFAGAGARAGARDAERAPRHAAQSLLVGLGNRLAVVVPPRKATAGTAATTPVSRRNTGAPPPPPPPRREDKKVV